ncbi:MAG: hypothetical protein KGI90_08840 [Burkholderiales bacterium]|nr:hypothetical protein [Burkholderiales bacterium]
MTTEATDLGRLVPGFDFLQGLVKNAGAALPGMGQWIAPTLEPAELDKRIQELRTVQFWLEQNAKLLAATIQALEVQRMTLSTLQSMNLPMAELREALTIKPVPAPAPAPAPAPPTSTAPSAPSAAAPAIDPMQWWGALTRQFTDIASQALADQAAKATQAPQADGPAAAASAARPAPAPRRAPAAQPAPPRPRRR